MGEFCEKAISSTSYYFHPVDIGGGDSRPKSTKLTNCIQSKRSERNGAIPHGEAAVQSVKAGSDIILISREYEDIVRSFEA
jgi:hypothetical protein